MSFDDFFFFFCFWFPLTDVKCPNGIFLCRHVLKTSKPYYKISGPKCYTLFQESSEKLFYVKQLLANMIYSQNKTN